MCSVTAQHTTTSCVFQTNTEKEMFSLVITTKLIFQGGKLTIDTSETTQEQTAYSVCDS